MNVSARLEPVAGVGIGYVLQSGFEGRQEHAAKFHYDLDAIAKDIRSREGKDGEPVVTLPPKLRPVPK